MAKKNKVKKPTAPKAWTNNIASPAAYAPGTYTSEYADRIEGALDKVTNWSYDPLQDASYQALAKVYNQRGNLAAKNSLADAAALNGGYGTSYAVSAAQQARNEYNQELAALIPDFENAAYNRATNTLSALREADESAYGRFRDTETDKQWQYSQDYQAYRDKVSDSQWSWTNEYNKYRDLMSDYQWTLQWNASKKGSSGGGGRRSSGGGGGYSGINNNNDNTKLKGNGGDDVNIKAAQEKGKSMTQYYKNQVKKGRGARR